MRAPSPLAFVLAASLALVGCAEDEGDEAARQALSSLVAEDLVASQQDGAIAFDEAQATCTADELIDRFGTDQLRTWGYDEETGSTPAGDLTIDDGDRREDAWSVLLDCVDVTEQITTILEAGGSLDGEQAACVAERYVDSDIAAHAVFGPGDAEVNAEVDGLLEDAVATCS